MEIIHKCYFNTCDALSSRIRSPKRKFVTLCVVLCIILPLIVCGLSRIPALQDFLIRAGEVIKGRALNHAHWHERIPLLGKTLLLVGCLAFFALAVLHVLSLGGKKALILERLLFFLYLLVTLICALRHEGWFDEVHAWRLSRDMSVAELFHYMRYEGHFLPWYLILMPFAKLGFPLITLSIISWLLNAAAMFLFVRFSPFPPFAKIIALCTAPLLFWYPIVSRPYVLLCLTLFFIATIYRKRNEKPLLFGFLLALLSNTHAYIEGLVGILFLFFFLEDTCFPWKGYTRRERVLHVASLCIILLGVLVAFLQVAPAFKESSILKASKPGWEGVRSFLYGSRIPITLWFFLFAALTLMLEHLFSLTEKYSLIFTLSLLWMIWFAYFLYGASVPNRAYLWFILLIFTLWIAEPVSLRFKGGFLIAASLFILNPTFTIRDFKGEFSCLHGAFSYIEKTYPAGTDVYFSRYFAESLYLKDYTLHSAKESRDFATSLEDRSKAIFVVATRSEDAELETRLLETRHARLAGEFNDLIWYGLRVYEVNFDE